MHWIILSCLLLAAQISQYVAISPRQTEFNRRFDAIVSKVNSAIHSAKLNKWTLRDIKNGDDFKISKLRISDFSKLERFGNAVTYKSGDSTFVKGSLTIPNLKMYSEDFEWKQLFEIGDGKMTVTFAKNRIDLNMVIGRNAEGKCFTRLGEFFLAELGGSTMQLEKSNPPNFLFEKAYPYFLDKTVARALKEVFTPSDMSNVAKRIFNAIDMCEFV